MVVKNQMLKVYLSDYSNLHNFNDRECEYLESFLEMPGSEKGGAAADSEC
jgi:hypothetical protein